MKIIKIYIVSLALLNTIQAASIEFSDTAQKDINKIILEKKKLLTAIQAYRKEVKLAIKKEKLEGTKLTLKNNFKNVIIDEQINSMRSKKDINHKLKGVQRTYNTHIPKQIALNFLHNDFSYLVGKNEEFKILNIGEEYGAEQEKDKNNKIKSNVNIKTYSYDVIIGRYVLDKPIFNSTGSIEIDPATDEIISFNFKNWSPTIIDEKSTIIKELSRSKIEDKIKKRISSKISQSTDIYKIKGVTLGWIIDKKSQNLIPAFIHHGNIEHLKKTSHFNTPRENHKFYYVERLDNSDVIRQKIKVNSTSQKLSLPKSKKIDKDLEIQGVKDTTKHFLFKKEFKD